VCLSGGVGRRSTAKNGGPTIRQNRIVEIPRLFALGSGKPESQIFVAAALLVLTKAPATVGGRYRCWGCVGYVGAILLRVCERPRV
jgi:hypothetical protein